MALTKSISPLAKASASGVAFKQLNLETAPAQRPEVIAVLGQYAIGKTVTDDVAVLSDGTPEQAYSLFGASPLYYAATKLFPKNGNGAKVPVYFVPIGVTTGGASAGTIDVTGTASKSFVAKVVFRELPIASAADAVGKIATNAQNNPARAPRRLPLDGFNTYGIRVAVAKGDGDAAIFAKIEAAGAANPDFPITLANNTTNVTATVKFATAYGDGIGLDFVMGDGSPITAAATGLTVTVVDTASGAGTYDISDALDALTANYGITRVVNQFDDDDSLDAIQAWGEALRDPLVGKYAISYFGREYDESGTVAGTVDVAAIATFGDGRDDDAVNSAIYGTYGDLRELTYGQRDTLLKAGISNVELRGDQKYLMDVVTFYHPEGVQNPIFTYDDSITKEGNLAHDLKTYFDSEEWASKIIVSVDSKSTNPEAIDVDDFASAIFGRAELWEKTALVASAQFVKENSTFEIDDSNPRRLNANIKAQLTSTASVIDNTLYLGFLFGESA